MDVGVVLVAHDGARWLPEALAALAAQTVRPRRVVAVDTGSTDESADLLAAAPGAGVDAVLRLPRRTGYGAAVAAALAVLPDADHRDDDVRPDGPAPAAPASAPPPWLWLLHDDCAPEPDALERLLEHAAREPTAVLLGPKVRDWDDPHLLVEVGLTTDTAGHRHTGLERGETDQGQHDAVRDVLAVGTAGALVRRDAWTRSGGLDPALPVFRDDLDLGWRLNAAGGRVVVVPSAAVRHARAATTGRRRVHAVRGRIAAVDRRHALLVLLAHAPTGRLPLLVLRLLVATLLRVLGFLLTRQVAAARDELGAALSVLLRPRRLAAARRSRAATRTVPSRALRPLLASPGARARSRAEAVGEWLSGSGRWSGAPSAARAGGGRESSGPDPSDEFDEDAPSVAPLWRQALVRPGVVLTLGLLCTALVAERQVLGTAGGLLAGGRLLPPPDGARDLWSAYAASWHPVSVGSPVPAPPSLAVLAALSTLLLGKAWLAVDLLLLGSVPLAGAAAYAAASRVVGSPALRLWAGATWALLPVATGAVAAGRLDAAAGQVALPLLLLAGARLAVRDPRTTGWSSAWALGLGLALTCALTPVLLPLAAVLLLGAAAAGLVLAPRGRRGAAVRRAGAATVAVLVPLGLLAPWGPAVLEHPGLLLHGPGRVAAEAALADPALPGWHLPLLSPGGAALPPVGVTLGLLLAAAGGTLRDARRALALSGWAVALTGLAGALVLARTAAAAPGTGEVPVWPGTALQVAAAGLLVAALVAADGLGGRLAAADFGARQLGACLVALLAGALPLLAAGAWVVRGADDPLHRDLPAVLPAFAQAELLAVPGTRALVLQPGGGGVSYALTGPEGERLGADSTRPDAGQTAALDAVVADLLTPSGSSAAAALSTRAVRYVVVHADEAGGVPAVLDAQQGLVRRSRGALLLWEVALPAGHLVLLPAPLAEAALRGDPGPAAEAVRDAPPLVLAGERPVLPPGAPGRLLVLSEAADPGWTAAVGGGPPLPGRTAWGWAAAFEVPAAGGAVRVEHEGGRRGPLVAQALALGLVLVLAAPGPSGRRGLEPAGRPVGRAPVGHAAPAGHDAPLGHAARAGHAAPVGRSLRRRPRR